MICLIDNYDSFTYNIFHLLQKITRDIIILKNTCSIKDIETINPNKIIISPGPGNPSESGICNEVIDVFKNHLPILGICLGHQVIGQYFNSQITTARCIMHGKKSLIQCSPDSQIFKGLPKKFYVGRYHSLAIGEISKELQVIATDIQDNDIMAIQHVNLPIFGVQFHPESFLSEYGLEIIKNFVDL